jgi:hypothetical protein
MACMEEITNVDFLNPKGKRTLRKPKWRQEDNIKMYIKESRLEAVDWINFAHDRDWWWAPVNTAMHLQGT